MFVVIASKSTDGLAQQGLARSAASTAASQDEIEAQGLVRPSGGVVLASPIESEIVWLVESGTHVEEGDLLVQLSSDELESLHAELSIVVEQIRAELISAEHDLVAAQVRHEGNRQIARIALEAQERMHNRMTAENGELDVREKHLENRVGVQELQLDLAQTQLSAVSEGSASELQIKAAIFDVQKAELELTTAQEELRLFQEYVRDYEVSLLELEIAEAKTRLDVVSIEGESEVAQFEAALQSIKLEYERQMARREMAAEQITRCRIVAPIDGVVRYEGTASGRRARLDSGSMVRERQVLLRVGPPNSWEIITQVDSRVSSEIAAGDRAIVNVDAFVDQPITAVVEAINRSANERTRTVMVRLSLDGESETVEQLREGMTALVTFGSE